jgi:hypothetical protein
MNDFSKKIIRALAKKGIFLIGPVALPRDGSYLNPDRGYQMNDNGCGKIWYYNQVIEAAN